MTERTRRQTLEAFAKACGREAHILARRPDLLGQQLANRLQWDDASFPVVDKAIATLPLFTARAWLRAHTRPRESAALVRTLAGHERPIAHLAFAPRSRLLASASQDESLRVWNLDGAGVTLLRAHTNSVVWCAFSPDESLLASCGRDGLLALWHLPSGLLAGTARVSAARATCGAWSPSGQLLVAGGSDGILSVVDPASLEVLARISPGGPVVACALSGSGEVAIAALQDGSVRGVRPREGTMVWSATGAPGCAVLQPPGHADTVLLGGTGPVASWIDVETGAVTNSVPLPDPPVHLAVSPDGAVVALLSKNGALHIVEATQGDRLTPVSGVGDGAQQCGFADDRTVWTARRTQASLDGSDFRVRLYDAHDGSALATLSGHTDAVMAVVSDPSGRVLYTAGADHSIRAWSVPDEAQAENDPAPHEGFVTACDVRGVSAPAVACGQDARLTLWDEGSPIPIGSIRLGSAASACRLSTGVGAVALGRDGGLWRCDLARRTATKVADCPFGGLGSAAAYFATISPSTRLVVWTSVDAGMGVLVLVDAATGKELTRARGHAGNIYACAVDPSDSFMVSGGIDGTVMTWRIQKGLFGTSIKEASRVPAHDNPVTACAVGEGAGLVVSGDAQGVVRVWRNATRSPFATLGAHAGRVTSIALAEQAGVFATAGYDGWIRLWRSDTCAEVASLPTSGRLYCAGLSDDGCHLIAGGEGGDVHVLSLEGRAG